MTHLLKFLTDFVEMFRRNWKRLTQPRQTFNQYPFGVFHRF
jgi:hypothetical protein